MFQNDFRKVPAKYLSYFIVTAFTYPKKHLERVRPFTFCCLWQKLLLIIVSLEKPSSFRKTNINEKRNRSKSILSLFYIRTFHIRNLPNTNLKSMPFNRITFQRRVDIELLFDALFILK